MTIVADRCGHGLTAAFCGACRDAMSAVDKMRRRAWGALEEAPGDGLVVARYDGWCARESKCEIRVGDRIGWDVDVDGWACERHLVRED